MNEKWVLGENGASSVLVIFMMLAMATLGAYTISSARVNYVFSGKALEWNRAYYECDAKAERFLMELDRVLAEAGRETAQGIAAGGAGTGLGAVGMRGYAMRLFSRHLAARLPALRGMYPEMEISGDYSIIDMPVSAGGKAKIGLKIEILPPGYEFEGGSGAVRGALDANASRYAVLEWKQSQTKAESAGVQDPLWDGSVEE